MAVWGDKMGMAEKLTLTRDEIARRAVAPHVLTEEEARRYNAQIDAFDDLTEDQKAALRKKAGDQVWEL